LLAAVAQAAWGGLVIGVDTAIEGWWAPAILALLAVGVLAGLAGLGFLRPDRRLAG
jgi:hypothetical protein